MGSLVGVSASAGNTEMQPPHSPLVTFGIAWVVFGVLSSMGVAMPLYLSSEFRPPAAVNVMKITEALLAEHMVFHNLFDYIEATLPKLKTLSEVHALAGVLEATLNAHSQVEDQLLIEPLGHCFAQFSQQETFHDEHEEIDELLKEALHSRSLKSARRILQNVVVASRNHFDKEERLVFPMAEKALNARTLASLGETWMRQRKAGHG